MTIRRQWICLLLALVLGLSLCACAVNEPKETTEPAGSSTTETPTTETPTTEPSATQPPTTEPPASDLGTMEKPADLVRGSNTAMTTGAGAYYFTWTAPQDGTLTLTMDASTEDWAYEIFNLTAGDAFDQAGKSTDEVVSNPVLIPVLKADQLLIAINTSGGTAGTVKLSAAFGEDLIGTAGNPHHVTVGSTTAIRVPAGATVYFSGRCYGTEMVIENAATAKVLFRGTEYLPSDGIITAEMPVGKAGASAPLDFAISNTSDSEAVYTVSFQVPKGDISNPAELVMGKNLATVKAEDPDGYIFTWTATADGTLTLTMPSGDWWYVMHNMTTYQYGEFHYSSDDPVVNPGSITVKKGDVIQISVSTFDPIEPNIIPAGTVEFTAAFE